MAIHITIGVDPQKASPNGRSHWAKAAKIKKELRSAASLAWIAAGKPRVDHPVEVTIIVRRGRIIDQDNALAACKALIDGLFSRAITPNDSRQWIASFRIEQETGRKWQYAPEVEFVVTRAATGLQSQNTGIPEPEAA